MNLIQGFKNLPNRFNQSVTLDAIKDLLDKLAVPALLIEAEQGRILSANAHAAELTAYTRTELYALDLPRMFPQLQDSSYLQKFLLGENERMMQVLKRGGQSISVNVDSSSLGEAGRWQLVTFESANSRAMRSAERRQQATLWESLHKLAAATHETKLQDAFHQSLEAGHLLTSADHLAIYRLLPHEPGLERYAVWGDPNAIPAQFKTINMTILRTMELWTPTKHPASHLQRAARSAGFKYLLSFPLGEPNALDGLLVLGDKANPPPLRVEQVTRVLADAITTIFQKNILTINLQDRLHLQKSDLALSKSIQESVESGVIVLSTNLLIQELNQAAELTLSYATSEVKTKPVHNILIGTDTLIPALKAAQEGIPTLNMGSIRLHRRDGKSFQAHVRITPVKVDNKVERIIVVFQDLSERESLRLSTQQLEQRALLGEVTAIFAHEVRNPINNISSGLQLMSHQLAVEDPQQKSVKRMLDDCKRLDHLMKSVLDFSKTSEYHPEPVDLNTLVQRLFDRWNPRMKRENVKSVLQIEGDTPPVQGDRRALEQVFTNLISNAVQAMHEDGGTLAVKAVVSSKSREKPRLLISISDSGPGISEENRAKIFQPFFTTNPEGTGLGLAITKQIIIAHKGTINVDSFPGGTVFHISLPIADLPIEK